MRSSLPLCARPWHGMSVVEVYRRLGADQTTFDRGQRGLAGMGVAELHRLLVLIHIGI
jgi:hypothetical protein